MILEGTKRHELINKKSLVSIKTISDEISKIRMIKTT